MAQLCGVHGGILMLDGQQLKGKCAQHTVEALTLAANVPAHLPSPPCVACVQHLLAAQACALMKQLFPSLRLPEHTQPR